MNKKTIITVLLVVMTMSVQTASADVEINKTNFPDDIFRNWILHQEYGTDGILTDIEIANVTYRRNVCVAVPAHHWLVTYW